MAAMTSGASGPNARPEPVDHLATGCEEELLEVPLHVARLAAVVGCLGQLGLQRVSVRTVDVGLGQQRERHPVRRRAERLDLLSYRVSCPNPR